MRRLFVPPEKWLHGAATIEGDAHRHLARVLRARPGDRLVLFDGEGREVDAEVVSVERERTMLALVQPVRVAATTGARIVLLQSLARGDRMDWIVQKTTELGVAVIIPVSAGRSVARLETGAAAPRRARWEKIAREAARQCGRADVPVVGDPLTLAHALVASREQGAGGAGARFALWEASHGHPLRQALTGSPRAVTLLVGPEGGFADTEVQEAITEGFQIVGLGPRILRVETAAVVAVALVQAAAGGLD